MLINSLLTSGIEFDDSEEYLEFRFRMLNAVMLTGVLFTVVFIGLDWAGWNSLGRAQLLATQINCLCTIALIFLLRRRKPFFVAASAAFVAINFSTFMSALLLVVNDELRVIWFFVQLVVIYILLGLRAGVFMTLVTVISILAANRFIDVPFSPNAMTTLLIALSVTSLLSYVYTSRALSYFERMRLTKIELQELAEKDPLTGLLNPRAYYDLANRMIWLAHRTSTPYALLFIDLDHFKAINDNFGHETGDAILRSVAHSLSAHLRHTDVLGRIGGEEFAAFLPDTTLEAAAGLGEKLRSAVESLNPLINGGALHGCTVSIGVAGKCASDESVADLQRRADRAMYQAKRQGRNQVVVESLMC